MNIRLKQNDKIGFIFFIAFVASTILIYQFEERFDQDTWRQSPSLRYKMVDDILEKKLFINATKTEVIEQLGQPNESEFNDTEVFTYEIGVEESFSDPKLMQLKLTFRDNRVIKVHTQPK
ncbi:hypothetical protein ITJ86_03110 [Winogradskyella sp. F6397]|uniref:Uncharacterized protein n=1 Tax=Winogradskyella marina TaxID=2785530 RepID=A0ABS0EEP7_9FLAO|nr:MULTISPECIES: hypothetical protein [Winogradskyella]MBF8148869.1 hypothetical protein [Winogradskyella marina]